MPSKINNAAPAALCMFDLDGTLVNTVDAIVLNANRARVLLGFSERPVAELAELVGLNPVHFFSDLNVSKEKIDILVNLFRENLNLHSFGYADVYPGVRDILDLLASSNFQLAIATNKPTDNAKLLLQKVGLLNRFSHVQGSENLPSKPAPDILIACRTHFGSMPTIMVGDRVEDVLAGTQAGFTTVGIAQTAHSIRQFRGVNADFAFNNMKSLLFFLESDDGLVKLQL